MNERKKSLIFAIVMPVLVTVLCLGFADLERSFAPESVVAGLGERTDPSWKCDGGVEATPHGPTIWAECELTQRIAWVHLQEFRRPLEMSSAE